LRGLFTAGSPPSQLRPPPSPHTNERTEERDGTVLVITDTSEVDGEVVYRESVGAVHLEGHAGAQLVERLRWAVRDAQVAEHRAMLKAVETVSEEQPAA
jgi:hypothetical protein